MHEKYRMKVYTLLSLLLLGIIIGADIPNREDIQDEFLWDLSSLYISADTWENDYSRAEYLIKELSAYKGQLATSNNMLLKCLQLHDEIARLVERLEVYAYLNKDEDTRINATQARSDQALSLRVRFRTAGAFLRPEILNFSHEQIQKMIADTPELEVYQQYLHDLLRQQPHTLSANEEELIAKTGKMADSPWRVYEAITSSDMQYPYITNVDGASVQLSPGRYYRFLGSPDRSLRHRAAEGILSTYEDIQHSTAAALDASIKKDIFNATIRNYESTLSAALSADNIPVSVYHNLIKTVKQHLESLDRYLSLRREILGLDELHMYDLNAPIVPDLSTDIPYTEAREIIAAAFQPLGLEYMSIIETALADGWIDVYENLGKASGAYSWGAYDSHPYILLNFNDTMEDVFTLAHELGHAAHSFLTNRSQDYVNSEYTLFVAEVASTFDERLLLEYLLTHAKDDQMRIALLDHWIGNFIGTVYIQTMFADFELRIHEMGEAEIPLTAKALNETYWQVLQEYFGTEVVLDPMYAGNWARISHFYEQFYVYKYATSFCASSALAQGVLQGEPGARERYLEFLSAGRSDYSLDLLRRAGVDLSSPEPIETALELFDQLVQELDLLVKS